jgi:DNA-directed RNA polymerase specialized sigma24 family protein
MAAIQKKDEALALDQNKALAGVLGLLIAEREERLNEQKDPRKTEIVLADAGLGIGEIAKLMGKKYDAVKQAVRRGRK